MRYEPRSIYVDEDQARERAASYVRAVGGTVRGEAGQVLAVELPSWAAVCGVATLLGLDGAEVDPALVDLALRLGTVARALAWVQREIDWRDEPGERLSHPSSTLARRWGDCDDSATLLVALFSALGYPAAVLGCTLDGVPVHAVAAVSTGSGWHWADGSEPTELEPWARHPLERDERAGVRGIVRPTLVAIPNWP